MGNTRKLILTREKKFNEGIAEWVILVDGNPVGRLGREETKEFIITQQAHRVSFLRPFLSKNKGWIEQEIKVADLPGNFLDWHIHITCTTNFITGQTEVEITEDYGQATYNKRVWGEYLAEKENKNTIDRLIDDICRDSIGTRDFSRMNQLPSQNKNTQYYRDAIYSLRNVYYRDLVDRYFNQDSFGIDIIIRMLKDLETIDLISEEVKGLLKHYDYFVTQKNFINSVLTDNYVEELELIRDTANSFPEELIVTYEDAKQRFDNNDIKGALSIILFADHPVTYYDEMKRFLLKCALLEGENTEFSDCYKLTLKATEHIFKPRVIYDEQFITVNTVDTIIAEAIRYSNVNSISEVNEMLEQFLTLTAPIYKVDASQYVLLQNVFNGLQAYEQEKMVLEAMVINCISRTPEQEQRLEFLKNTKISNLRNSSDTMCEDDVSEGKFIYDYRFVGYSDKDLKDYFTDLSLKNKTLDKPVVVREWNKSINVDSFKYDIDKLHEHLKATMSENFPDRYKVGITSAAPASTGELVYEREYVDAILIMDDITYNWLAFYIEGEQLLKSKITFSIYAVYMPMFDLFVDIEEDIYKQNEKICNKIEVLKKQMNPKFNTYMNTIIEVIIEDLENWLNNSGSSNSIYD